jgi:hypothetical protein
LKARDLDKKYRSTLHIATQNDKAILEAKRKEALAKAPTVTEKVTENILIRIPKKFAEAEWPAIIAAIKYYIASAKLKANAWSSMRPNYKREMTQYVHLWMDKLDTNGYMAQVFSACLGDSVKIIVDSPLSAYAYDMYFEFDERIAQTFRDNGKFHAAAAFGIMLGCEAQALYDIPVDKIIERVTDKVESDILVIDDAYYNFANLWEIIGKSAKQQKVTRILTYMNDFPSMIAAVDNAKVVVGGCSMYTYLACCMNKPVYEIYPPSLSKNWLSKWMNKKYMMYQGNVAEVDYDTVLKGVGTLWHIQEQLSSRQQAVSLPTVVTPMGQSQSTVASADTASQM